MIVSVRYARNRNLTSILKKTAIQYAYMLMSPKLVNQLELKIPVSKKLQDNASGYCCPEEFFIRPKVFEIELKKTYINRMLLTLAHEMVHLKQFATNELRAKYIKGECITKWQGKVCDIDNYEDQPWEKEAYFLEEVLFCNLNNKNENRG